MIIFIIVLFIYLHVWYHIKTSNDLEVYNIDNVSKDKLEEILNIRQPVQFNFNNDEINDIFNIDELNNKYGIFDIKIRDLDNSKNEYEKFLPLTLNEAINLFKKDKNSKYIMENNMNFLNETTLIKTLKYNDNFLRPTLLFNSKYDILSGSKNSITPLRYELNYRNFFYVSHGSIQIKLVPPKFKKYLFSNNDYVNFEFISPLNLWDIQDKFSNNYNKIKVLDITLKKGDIIYIPAYWYYTIKYDDVSIINNFKYKTFMNIISILPQLFMKLLQQQNIKLNNFNKIK
tara:strand:+ start:101 stop:961 length:861 start_codon:yes stop_codon:yes gene_type:complete